MTPMMLVLALSAGQGPAGGYHLPPGYGPQINPTPVSARPGLVAGRSPQPAPGQSVPPATSGDGKGSESGPDPDPDKDEKEKKDEEKAKDEPWALMRVLKGTYFGSRLEERGVTISGWTEGNYTASTAHRSNLPVTFNDRANFWQMNQNFLRIAKPTDSSKEEFQVGGLAELILPGTDARLSAARGLLDRQSGDYRIDLFQAYVETFHPGLGPKGTTVKWGKFATHCEYELVQGAETPFLSRSYLFQYNPFTHTGGWAITPLNDTWTMSHGLALGSDNFFGAPSRLTYLGQLKWAPKEGKTNVLLNAVVTDPTFDVADNFAFYNVYNMQVTHKFTDKFTGVLDSAFSHMDGVPGVNGAAVWYGAAAYGIYQINDKLSATMRNELFDDNKGIRTGFRGLYYDLAFTMAWSPVRSLIFRPGVRYDHNFDSAPFEGKQNLFTASMDMIVRW